MPTDAAERITLQFSVELRHKRTIPRVEFWRVKQACERYGTTGSGWPLVSWLRFNETEHVIDAILAVAHRGEQLTAGAVEAQLIEDSRRARRGHRADGKRDRRAA